MFAIQTHAVKKAKTKKTKLMQGEDFSVETGDQQAQICSVYIPALLASP